MQLEKFRESVRSNTENFQSTETPNKNVDSVLRGFVTMNPARKLILFKITLTFIIPLHSK